MALSLAFDRAVKMSVKPAPSAAIFAGSGTTWISFTRPPCVDHVGDAGHAHERGADDPVLGGAQAERIAAVEGVAVDLADRRCQRAHLRGHSRRQISVGEALVHLLAREQRIDPVLEGEGQGRQAEKRDAPLPEHPGSAVQGALERDRDATLDLLGGLAMEKSDHVDLGVGRIGEGLDGQLAVGEVPSRRHRDGEDEDHQLLAKRKS